MSSADIAGYCRTLIYARRYLPEIRHVLALLYQASALISFWYGKIIIRASITNIKRRHRRLLSNTYIYSEILVWDPAYPGIVISRWRFSSISLQQNFNINASHENSLPELPIITEYIYISRDTFLKSGTRSYCILRLTTFALSLPILSLPATRSDH